MTRFSVLHLLERHDEVMNDVSAAADWLLQLLSQIAAKSLKRLVQRSFNWDACVSFE